ncbi:hypothetical protein [Desulfofustis limnaeus]|uniref:Response regulator n=1 Tax=Desulfofustis limnaeus TaxID=2740163 RepID=A0ABM7W8X2_9BACT|nr:hypothetical protein [Desulfofustis limnaeus]BDD87319.1 hypothetical protein DPPLL_16840 [Desulfofustis limnaeus]
MKALQRFEKIVEAVRGRIEEEVTSLIGEQLSLTLQPGSVIDKNDFFDQPIGKVVLARIDLTGEISGQGALIVSVKDAIRLGGTLIMLPPTELEEVVGSEQYGGETEDSYGEIANIIAGSYTKIFEELSAKACRFIRKEQQVVVPLKVAADSDEPIPNQAYYQIVMEMELEQRPLGNMFMLVPAEPFGLVEKKEPQPPPAEAPQPSQNGAADASAEPAEAVEVKDDVAPTQQPAMSPPSAPAAGGAELKAQRKKIDALLELCRQRIGEEVGALLGVSVEFQDLANKPVGKEAFFYEETSGKQVVADLEVVGDKEDVSYLYLGLKDAIRIGGTLIMLPPSELESAVSEEDFGVDSQDAYGEIANIIAGVYTAVFEEHYGISLRFIKKDIEQIVPMKVDIGADQPMPDQLYYVSSMVLSMGGTSHGRMQAVFPARLLDLEGLGITEPAAEVPESRPAAASAEAADDYRGATVSAGESGAADQGDILIVSDTEAEASLIAAVLDVNGLSARRVSFRDNLKNVLPGRFKAVFLVMQRVDEQAFGMAIKISASCSLPLIAAGPEWTRSKVLKAVRYGVTDILLTPAEPADVEEKIRTNILSLAA